MPLSSNLFVSAQFLDTFKEWVTKVGAYFGTVVCKEILTSEAKPQLVKKNYSPHGLEIYGGYICMFVLLLPAHLLTEYDV